MKLLDSIKNKDIYFIAEMSGNHGGKLDNAIEIVRAAANAGADCLKIQTFTADTITIDCNAGDFQTMAGGLWEGRTLYDLYNESRRSARNLEWIFSLQCSIPAQSTF